ncbi:CPBP family intramembrane glutamic endopeptidase [Pedobacter sp. FW305-3-2-15-E-R2A2]|jgi:membrane protease YdiL (CAAX protease family)|uniref:CPBP family intramembrane glutamic endopeptidase n=1 Tax=Pedobacter sp. FW305-3-2-15-E-R2A2 TaxID=3140251 RepID=UPI003140946B
MNLKESESAEKSPYLQLLSLCIYAIAGVFITLILSLLAFYFMYGEFMNYNWLEVDNPNFVMVNRVLISLQQMGLFLVPALFLALGERKKMTVFYNFRSPKLTLLLLTIALMAASMPLMEFSMQLNQKMALPEFLKSIEEWMKSKEDGAMATTEALLKMDHIGTYLLNIILIGILPAVCEELMFRGAIQRSLGRIFSNPHVAIWLSAFVFSAIHLQFYGFLPRFLLGAGFGYIYLWTRSLWYSIFAHFLNNAYAVTAAWYMQKNNIPLSESDKTAHFQWYGYVISVVLTVLLFKFLKNKTLKADGEQLDKGI